MSDRIQQLMVSTPQGRSGSLFKDSRFVFNYETQNRDQEISLTMPLRPESYASTILHSVFAMNKPEGWVLDRIQRKFAKITNLDDMRLLALTGGNQIGRLRYAVPDAAKEPLSLLMTVQN